MNHEFFFLNQFISTKFTSIYSIYEGHSESGNGAAININSNIITTINIEFNSFINNKSGKEGGALFYYSDSNAFQCTSFILRCCLFDKNSAKFTCSLIVSNRKKYFPLNISQIAIVNEYQSSTSSHLDVIGGNSLYFNNNNISNNNVPYLGLIIDNIESNKRGVFTYLNFALNSIGDGYFVHDQASFCENYYLENANFINNEASQFFSSTTKEKSPEFFNINFIFLEISIPIFNSITFHSCYFSHDISNQNNVNIDILLDSLLINEINAINDCIFNLYFCSNNKHLIQSFLPNIINNILFIK